MWFRVREKAEETHAQADLQAYGAFGEAPTPLLIVFLAFFTWGSTILLPWSPSVANFVAPASFHQLLFSGNLYQILFQKGSGCFKV